MCFTKVLLHPRAHGADATPTLWLLQSIYSKHDDLRSLPVERVRKVRVLTSGMYSYTATVLGPPNDTRGYS